MPETARRAIQNFFTAGNLTALRELALRRTADRVDDQMVDYLRQKAIEGPWGASERLLACVGADEVSERVVRRAAQLATSLNAAWTAVYIEPVGHDQRRQEGERSSPRRSVSPSGSAATRPGFRATIPRGDPAPRAARKRDPDRARPVARGNPGAPARPLPAGRGHAPLRDHRSPYRAARGVEAARSGACRN